MLQTFVSECLLSCCSLDARVGLLELHLSITVRQPSKPGVTLTARKRTPTSCIQNVGIGAENLSVDCRFGWAVGVGIWRRLRWDGHAERRWDGGATAPAATLGVGALAVSVMAHECSRRRSKGTPSGSVPRVSRPVVVKVLKPAIITLPSISGADSG